MFYSENLAKHGSELLIRKFMNTFIGSGKSTCVLTQAKVCLSKGEKVAIVTNGTFITREQIRNHILKDFPEYENRITEIHMDKVLKELNRYSDEYTEKDTFQVSWRRLPIFNGYDRIILEPACYEEIIKYLLAKLSEVKKSMKILKDF